MQRRPAGDDLKELGPVAVLGLMTPRSTSGHGARLPNQSLGFKVQHMGAESPVAFTTRSCRPSNTREEVKTLPSAVNPETLKTGNVGALYN